MQNIFCYLLAHPIETPFRLKQITKILIFSFVWTGCCSPELPKFNNSKPITVIIIISRETTKLLITLQPFTSLLQARRLHRLYSLQLFTNN